jgi:tetratricopeptide (TPR) repeat protein
MRLLFVAFLLLFTVAQTQSLSTKVLTTEARELLRQGNSAVTKALLESPSRFIDEPLWREAINYGLAAKQAAPTSAEPYGFLGKVYSYVNFYDASWDAYTSFRALGGTADDRQREQMIYLGRKLGYEFFDRGEFETALEYYLVAYHYAPGDQEINLQIARSYLGNNRADLASAYLRQLDAQHLGDYGRYLETATDHISYGQTASDAYERGIVQYYLGNLSSARDSFAEATRLEPTFQKAFVWAGRVSLELSQPDAALPYWQQAQALAPNSATMQYFLDVTQQQIRWGALAYTLFEQGMRFYNEGKMSDARTSFAEAARQNASFTEAWAWLGRIAYEGADYATAYEAFDRATRLSSDESYAYFKNASARELGLDRPQQNEVAAVTSPANLEQAAPVQEVKQLESISESPDATEESQVVSVDETTQLNSTDTPDTSTNAGPSSVPLELLRTTYAYERGTVETNGAVSFFAAPAGIQKDWQTPVNYASGVVYQRLEVTKKPSSEVVTYQLCLVPNDDIAIKPACSRASGLEFSETGVYVFKQPLSEFYQYDNIDWSRGISNLMVILRDQNGNPVDTVFSSERGQDLDLYYPMNVRYSVVLVPAGGAFLGWP